MPRDWGKIVVGTRIEKVVASKFFMRWCHLISKGLRKGDAFLIEAEKVSHVAANCLVRDFLKTNADTLFMLDSDADIGPNFLNEFRDYQPGWEYDCLQAWYSRRGWPPESIWLKKSIFGDTYKTAVFGDDIIDDVAVVGTHAVLIRREVFVKLLGDNDPEHYDWFYYPRHIEASEDGAFSLDAAAAGFRLGATTHVKAGHIASMTVDWNTYQEYMQQSGANDWLNHYHETISLVSKFTGDPVDLVQAKVLQGTKNVRETWKPVNGGAECREYYGQNDNGYLYDLLNWNFGQYYAQITNPLKEVKDQKVLIVGGGIGGEVECLSDKNYVEVFELPGVLKNFLKFRYNGSARLLDGASLMDANLGFYDLIVMIDVVEHIHPDEFDTTMDTLTHALAQHGRFYIHANFGQQASYPMHFNHQAAFDNWISRNKLVRQGEYEWLRS